MNENVDFSATKAEIADLLKEASVLIHSAALSQQCVDNTFTFNPEYNEIVNQLVLWIKKNQ